MQIFSTRENLFELNYSASINAKARANKSVGLSNAQNLKLAISNVRTLSQCALLAHFHNRKPADVTELLPHKADALTMYRSVASSHLTTCEKHILISYLDEIIDALDAEIKIAPAKQPIYQVS